MNMSALANPTANMPTVRVVLISAEGSQGGETKTVLSTSPKIKLKEINPGEMRRELTATSGDMLILDVQHVTEHEIDLLNSIASQASDMPVIVISPQLDASEMRRLFKFGVHDWLPKPINPGDLFDSIAKGVRGRKANANRVHAVISTVGGAGASTLALTMADMARSKLGKDQSVALFDLDFSLGNCGTYANLPNDFDLASVAATPRRVDAEFIRAIQKKHERGFFLYSFKRPELNGSLDGFELVLRMLDAVSLEHNQTFIDMPYYMTEWRDDVLSAVNTCTLVTELNIAAIRHTIDMIDALKTIRGDNLAVQVVFNKWESHLFGQRVGRKQIRELFGNVPFHYIPVDNRTIGEAVDRGLVPSSVHRRSRFVRAVGKFLKTTHMLQETVE